MKSIQGCHIHVTTMAAKFGQNTASCLEQLLTNADEWRFTGGLIDVGPILHDGWVGARCERSFSLVETCNLFTSVSNI